MALVCLGLSHRTAPVEVRERHLFPPSRMVEALSALRDYENVREAAMLQTCGRIEFYAEVEAYEPGVAQLKSFLTNFRHGSIDYDLESYLYTLLGAQAVEHLLRVATGLDSMFIGEAEILGQVKDAYVQAHDARAVGPVLHRLFHQALRAGKIARSSTKIGGASPSIAAAAAEAARARAPLSDACLVVAGSGTMARSFVRHVQADAARIMVASRNPSRVQTLVADIGGDAEAVAIDCLERVLVDADVLVASIGASQFLLSRAETEAVMRARPNRPLLVIDLAVPRDVDPEVANVAGVTLLDVDGLRPVIEQRLDVRRDSIPAVEHIVVQYRDRFLRWYRSRLAAPIIASLTQKAETIRCSELERLFARCPDLTDRERALVTGMSLTIVSKLLHSAIANIREKADSGEMLSQVRLLDELFELDVADRISDLLHHAAPSGP